MDYVSQIGQDKLVVELLQGKRNGTFVDVGCRNPVTINNTFYLEKELGWRGVAIDKKKFSDGEKTWESERPATTLIIADALELDYKKVFKESGLPTTIDFLSMDLSPADVTLKCLYKIPFDEYRFRVVTYETDAYRLDEGIGGERRQQKSRQYFASLGYTLHTSLGVKNTGWAQDDIYVLDVEQEEN